jgi:hypothetical protein
LRGKLNQPTTNKSLSKSATSGSKKSAKKLMESMTEQNIVLYHLGFTVSDAGRLVKLNPVKLNLPKVNRQDVNSLKRACLSMEAGEQDFRREQEGIYGDFAPSIRDRKKSERIEKRWARLRKKL